MNEFKPIKKVKEVDVFGDGQFKFKSDELPETIVKKCGCEFKKGNAQIGVSYLGTKVCKKCQAVRDKDSAKTKEANDTQAKISNKIRQMAIDSLKQEGELPSNYTEG